MAHLYLMVSPGILLYVVEVWLMIETAINSLKTLTRNPVKIHNSFLFLGHPFNFLNSIGASPTVKQIKKTREYQRPDDIITSRSDSERFVETLQPKNTLINQNNLWFAMLNSPNIILFYLLVNIPEFESTLKVILFFVIQSPKTMLCNNHCIWK